MTVHRWAHEDRVTRRGTSRDRVRYDLRELPRKTADDDGETSPGPLPPPHGRSSRPWRCAAHGGGSWATGGLP
ncbi:hypothetical protein H340_22391 [Streptomyces mobaraensis NBRC 13819 = DSM 40847]|uniref:Uncharacterized protein n=1 Tax=Streptomyces mobaraensis (strain ATCC 29032 / DSM 40847 / JCM 4168 / NBRC 13819 / NCIMB 11159 / IPCR 16-22) TaxID=1223523 RepID=M3C2R7_STRM1|nr:hypothetical protein H340_22391 [Streptomyces mobaraensis NBRC 13819 = DSM 40847]